MPPALTISHPETAVTGNGIVESACDVDQQDIDGVAGVLKIEQRLGRKHLFQSSMSSAALLQSPKNARLSTTSNISEALSDVISEITGVVDRVCRQKVN